MLGSILGRRQRRSIRLGTIGLTVALTAISVWGLVSSHDLNASIDDSVKNVKVADDYQALRYQVAVDVGNLRACVLAPTAAAMTEYGRAAAAVEQTRWTARHCGNGSSSASSRSAARPRTRTCD